MTEEQIIKALEDLIKNFDGKAVDFMTISFALDLVNRQKAENEKLISKLDELESEYALYKISAQEQIEALIAGQETLQKHIAKKDAKIECDKQRIFHDAELINSLREAVKILEHRLDHAKSEAVKELIENLTDVYAHCNLNSTISIDVLFCDIKRIAKEMVGDTE